MQLKVHYYVEDGWWFDVEPENDIEYELIRMIRDNEMNHKICFSESDNSFSILWYMNEERIPLKEKLEDKENAE